MKSITTTQTFHFETATGEIEVTASFIVTQAYTDYHTAEFAMEQPAEAELQEIITELSEEQLQAICFELDLPDTLSFDRHLEELCLECDLDWSDDGQWHDED